MNAFVKLQQVTYLIIVVHLSI